MTPRKRVKIWALLALVGTVGATAQDAFRTGAVDAGRTEVELVSETAGLQPGQSVDVALRMKMDPHWHVYWINPGDTGLVPQVDWRLPEGFAVGELSFPVPERIPTPPLMSYGYEGEIFLLTELTAPEDWPAGETARIEAEVSWLVCEEACIPEDARLALELPVVGSGESVSPGAYADEIAATRAALPAEPEGAVIAYEELGDSIVFTLQWEGLEGVELADPYFYVAQESVADSAAEQSFDHNGPVVRVAVPKSEYFFASEEGYSGLLYSANGFPAADGVKAIRFHENVELAALGLGASEARSAAPADPGLGFGKALLWAFLGGMILNLMPCVFPVLSIKALGFVQQGGEDQKKALAHGLSFGVGVLVSFWALAGLLIGLRAAGQGLGWGFQLQQPEFVVAMLVVLFLFGLSLAGVFEIGTSAIGLQGKVKSDSYGGSFFSGVIATAVATPCTGPFMGPALGFALTLSAFESLTVFTFLAVGMATPYVALSANPALIKKLPRPGAWMETFKQAMAFPMFATCIWLIWLLGGHVGNDGLLLVLAGLLTIALAAWIYGRWSTPSRKPMARRVSSALAALALLGGIWLMLPREADADGSAEIVWQPYSAELVEELTASGQPVFVDFTADWCVTCKVNEVTVFSSQKVRDRIDAMGLALVKADWTKRDEEITRALERFGRSSVPLYLLYRGESGAEPKVLPQVLSPGSFIDSLDEIDGASQESIAMSE